MASPPLRGYGVHAFPVLLLLLLLLLLPLRVTPGTTCPTPISIEHADIRVKNYSVNSRERYVCNSGFKRKAGTSTLTECVINKNTNVAHWTTPNLKCIRDPSLAHYSPVPTVVTPKVTSQPESLSPPEKDLPACCGPVFNTQGTYWKTPVGLGNYRDRQSQVLPSPISCSNNDLGAYSLHLPQDNRDFSTQFQNDKSGYLYIGPLGWCRGCGCFPGLVHQIKANFSIMSCWGGNHGNGTHDCEDQHQGGRRHRGLTI
ncbi:interleukin-15 receptor subunit alpha isoform X2 [Grammomys surdaster]|uniref:interleukin-15 receptor subunit alpha isoform X2 n=1 Tax=Grammomys surdaster TaxID=491861 RepID=UPI0010A0923E|nr:interleukin-15 receptor subunit alpha isoform X2 [Grammomys surdaster]